MEESLCEFQSPIETDSATISRLVHSTASQWEEILEFTDRCGITPLLCWRFESLNLDTLIPSGLWKKLLEAYNFSVSRNVNIYHELNVVLRTLKSEGIEVIVLKGAYLAETIYGHLGLRTMGDVDLLAKQKKPGLNYKK